MLVGRHDVLAQLRVGLADARAGHGSLVLLSGEPGIGKTRIAEEAIALAAHDGFGTRWASCWDGEGAPAFWPWVQLLRAHAAATERWLLLDDAGTGSSELARLLPGSVNVSTTTREPAAESRFRLFDAVTSFLEQAAIRQPLLLVVDDLHWADPSTVALLRFVGSRLHGVRLLVVGTRRTTEPDPGFDDLASVARTIELRGLDRENVAELLGSVGASGDDAFVAAVHERSGGNPLFVRELARLLVAQGRMADPVAAVPAVPATVQPVIARRLGLLGPACRSVLEAAAVIGVEFDAELAASAAGEHDASPAITEAVRSGIVLASDRGCRFVHGLVRDVLYDAIDPSRIAALHRAIGAALERSGRTTHDQPLMHFARAGTPDDLERALGHAEAAAAEALTMLAFEEAASIARQALEIAARLASHDDHTRLRLLLLLGDAMNRCGDTLGARPRFVEAADVARRIGDGHALAHAALGFGYIAQLEAIGGVGVDATLRSLLEEALAATPRDSVDGVLLRERLATELVYVDPDRFKRLADEALTAARRLADPIALGHALELKRLTLFGGDHVTERLAIDAELIRIGRGRSVPDVEMRGHVSRVVDLLELGDIARVDEEVAATERLIEQARLRADRWYPAVWRAMRALLDGRIADAERLATGALDVGAAQGQGAIDHLGMQLIAIRREQGRLAELVGLIQDAAQRYPEIPAYRCSLALAYAESGQTAAALAELDHLAADGFAAIPRDYNFTASLMLLSIACDVLGASRHAEALAELWRGLEERWVFVGYAGICAGAVAHHLGALLVAAGRPDDAIAHLEHALEQHRRAGATVWTVRTEIALGRVLADRDPQRSRELLGRARATAEELGLIAAAASIERPTPGTDNVFRRDGELWAVRFEGRSVHVRDAKGVRDLAGLLAAPGQEVHAIDLVAGERVSVSTGGDEVIDAEARRAYKARVDELRAEADEASRMGDAVRAERARTELDTLTAQLASAYGLGGRSRKTGDPSERARKAVTERVRASIRRIAEAHPALGEHLQRSVNTGTFCSYTPDRPIRWVT